MKQSFVVHGRCTIKGEQTWHVPLLVRNVVEDPKSRYNCKKLRELRGERGVGSRKRIEARRAHDARLPEVIAEYSLPAEGSRATGRFRLSGP